MNSLKKLVITMKPYKHLYPEVSKQHYSLLVETRVSKHGDEITIYRVEFMERYVVFSSFASAVDFIKCNLE